MLPRLRWDIGLRKLWLGAILIKAFRRRAPMVELILTAFQEEDWTERIDEPLVPLCNGNNEPNRLRNQVQALNRRMDQKLIRFLLDGTGQGICWQRVVVVSGAAASTYAAEPSSCVSAS